MFLHLNWASNLTAVNNNESLLLLLLYIVYIHRTLSSTLTADSFPIVCFFTYFNLFYDRSMIVRIARKTQHFAVNIARKWIKKNMLQAKQAEFDSTKFSVHFSFYLHSLQCFNCGAITGSPRRRTVTSAGCDWFLFSLHPCTIFYDN